MTGIYAFGSSTPITRYIRVVPQQDVVKIVNRTLDGKLHVQTIGDAAKTLSIELQVDYTGRLTLEQLAADVGAVTVKSEGLTYNGHLIDMGAFTKPIRGQFRTTVTVAI